MNMGTHWKRLRQQDHKDMQQSINTRRTTTQIPSPHLAMRASADGVGELRSDGVEHSHGCESELPAAVKFIQGCERGAAGTSILLYPA
jgi:hypothetical protein